MAHLRHTANPDGRPLCWLPDDERATTEAPWWVYEHHSGDVLPIGEMPVSGFRHCYTCGRTDAERVYGRLTMWLFYGLLSRGKRITSAKQLV